jgi:hypothetical protein
LKSLSTASLIAGLIPSASVSVSSAPPCMKN